MRKCTNCGFENSDDNISCVACGFSMSPENFYSEWEITASGYQTQGIYNNNEKEPTNHKRKSIFNFKRKLYVMYAAPNTTVLFYVQHVKKGCLDLLKVYLVKKLKLD